MSHVCVRTVVEMREHVYNNIVTLEVDPNAREGRQVVQWSEFISQGRQHEETSGKLYGRIIKTKQTTR